MEPAQPVKPRTSGVKVFLIVLGGVFALIALVLAVVAVPIYRGISQATEQAKVDVTKNMMRGTQMALRLYFARFSVFPDDKQGLQAVVRAQFLTEIPNDAWGRPLGYRSEGESFVLTSLGEDGVPGGEGSSADLELRGPPY